MLELFCLIITPVLFLGARGASAGLSEGAEIQPAVKQVVDYMQYLNTFKYF